MMFRLVMCIWILTLTSGPTATFAEAAPRILAIGDSLLAWHKQRGRSIADVVSTELKEPIRNRSVGGARLMYELPLTGAMGLNVSRQFKRGPWEWVLVSGGGNDLLFGCGCSRCDRQIERMVSGDGRRGVVPNLLYRIRKTGAKVIVIGYLRSPGVGSMIDGCKQEGDTYEARLAKTAQHMNGVFFVSNADLVPHGDRSFHSGDMIHPSPKGSAAIGRRVAALIRQVDQSR
ncbi:SGNH/GDSL hydrolase family protein [Aliiroseovarius sp. CAU 1755]